MSQFVFDGTINVWYAVNMFRFSLKFSFSDSYIHSSIRNAVFVVTV
jgi:hypothetical protein